MELSPDTCQHVKDDGAQCRAARIHGSDFCFFHDPARAAERAAAQRAGGRHGRAAVLPPDTPFQAVKSAEDVVNLLSETINQVRTGALDPRVGNCIGYLSGIVLKAVEQGDLEGRLAVLEGIVSNQKRPKDLFDADPEDMMIEDSQRAGRAGAPA